MRGRSISYYIRSHGPAYDKTIVDPFRLDKQVLENEGQIGVGGVGGGCLQDT